MPGYGKSFAHSVPGTKDCIRAERGIPRPSLLGKLYSRLHLVSGRSRYQLLMALRQVTWLFLRHPGPTDLRASEIYSADGKLIGKYFNENRTPVEYDEVTPDFFKALVDTEDERFYKHIGIDPIGVFAAAKDALLHHNGRGASTITQQLAKNMFRVRSQYSTGLLGKIPVLRLLIIKSKEWIIAVKLETVFSKKEIITMYANTVDFGSNSYGIKTAAKTYFNTTPKELTTGQAAVLVGMLKATTYYNPRTNRRTVLHAATPYYIIW